MLTSVKNTLMNSIMHPTPCYPGPYLQDIVGTGYGVPIEGTDNCL